MPTNDQIKTMIDRLEHPRLSLEGNRLESLERIDRSEAAEMLRKLLAEREWRDMDNAPRDGTRFLARGSYIYPGDKFPTIYTDIVEYSGDESYPWRVDGGGNHPSCSFDKWLPLPTPETGE